MRSSCFRSFRAALLAVATSTGMLVSLADAASITTSYEAGYRDVIINGYGTAGMGTFRLRDGGIDRVALCVEAAAPHSTVDGAYRAVDTQVESVELDALLWWLSRQPSIDDDTGLAAAALAWYYAGAVRSIGVPVWADGSRSFAPITPESPHPWDALPTFSMTRPVGLVRTGEHLDIAERRVAELHRLAQALRGPWELRAVANGFLLSGPGGPIVGHPVEISVTTPGATFQATATTGDDGVAIVDLPEVADGATVDARTETPGRHAEWDGDGAVQRMATATTRVVDARFVVPPLPRHLQVAKRSADSTIGVDGAVFELRDGAGSMVARVTTDARGEARFAPIDPTVHPAPYALLETSAPAGLVAHDEPIRLHRLSTDPSAPTIAMVENHPATIDVEVHKDLSDPDLGPSDRSGFEFELRRRADGATHHLTTAADGTASVAGVPAGSYDVCETAAPQWASGFTDPGCQTLIVDTAALATGRAEIVYVNLAPTATIDTEVRDPVDGDRALEHDAEHVTDLVHLDGLVPGTTYSLVAAVQTPHGDLVGDPVTFELVASDVDAHLDIELAAPAAPGVYVVTEWLRVGDRTVAEHAVLDDPDQTFTVAPPPTTTTSSTTTTMPPTSTTIGATATTVLSTTTSSTSPLLPPPASPRERLVDAPLPDVPPTVPEPTAPPTLPPTGATATTLLRWGDLGFLVGVGLIAVAGLVPRRERAGR